ncbi:MAG: NUDIX domain-containing protein [Candidatus Dormibacteria bacterium]
MGHIHELIDFTVCGVICESDRVLMVHHRGLGRWLFPGGHIELDEDPDQALEREMLEETGLAVDWFNAPQDWPPEEGIKFLRPPHRAEIHPIDATHRHVTLVYYGLARGQDAVLAHTEHHEIRWVARSELDSAELNLPGSIRAYALEALGLAESRSGG